MDCHSMNLQDAGLLFLSLKPRLLKYTAFATEKQKAQRNDLRGELTQLPNSATTRIKGRGR
ncbi:MAG: hypothetical protein AB7L09_12760 [Nitrospira sp.]